LKALLKPAGLEGLAPGEYYFCPSPDCPVVYFGCGGSFLRNDIGVAVFQKEAAGRRIACYCLEVTEDQLRSEVQATGASKSAGRIRDLIGSDRCACELRNPQGSCCLGNVTAIVNSACERLST
jgi:hypothetical protein